MHLLPDTCVVGGVMTGCKATVPKQNICRHSDVQKQQQLQRIHTIVSNMSASGLLNAHAACSPDATNSFQTWEKGCKQCRVVPPLSSARPPQNANSCAPSSAYSCTCKLGHSAAACNHKATATSHASCLPYQQQLYAIPTAHFVPIIA